MLHRGTYAWPGCCQGCFDLKSLAGFGGGIWLFTLFKGYDWVTVLVVANLAFSGLLVSWVMKFADSILKVRAHAHDVSAACSVFHAAICLVDSRCICSTCTWPCQHPCCEALLKVVQ